MDEQTIAAYDKAAAEYCDDWLGQPPPADMYELCRRFFHTGGPTIDVGSGSGREVDWLNRNGYPCIGVDASRGLITQAQRRFPQWRFLTASLPELSELTNTSYRNVLCETVLMHLPAADVVRAVVSLGRILAPGATLYLSWRVTSGDDVRDPAGRLYSAFPERTVRQALAAHAVLYDQGEISQSSGKRVHRLIVRRADERGT